MTLKSLMKVMGKSLNSSLTQHLLQGNAHSFWRQGWETFRESLNGLPHWKYQQWWLMTIFRVTESCRKLVTDVHWVSFFTFSDVRKTDTDTDHQKAEDEDTPPTCGDLHLYWKNYNGMVFVQKFVKICWNTNCCNKCTFARVFDDTNRINCQLDLWWHLLTKQNVKAINRIGIVSCG